MPGPSSANQIQMYMHCAKCLEENKPPHIDAGWTRAGFQVWCLNHNINVIHVDFQGARHPANSTCERPPEMTPKEDIS